MKLAGDRAMRQLGEPTVEEILESIKKVIARDNRAGAAEERRARETAGMAEPETADGQPVEDDTDEDDVLDLADAEFAISPPEGESPLLTQNAESSMRDSL